MTFVEEGAKSIGVDVEKVKRRLFIIIAILIGTYVALSRTIGFVNLIPLHVVRKIFGSKHSYVVPMSIVLGGFLMVFLAIACVQEPEVILLDEPTDHLDLKYQIEILNYIRNWCKKNNKILISVIHDLNLVQNFADRVILIEDGFIKDDNKTEEVLSSKTLEEVYKIDIKEFMLNTLSRWK